MLGCESTPFGSMYVLRVELRTKDKFLYRRRIWIDSEDFAVVRLQGEPTKNPSLWTRDSELEQVYVKVSDFWLPVLNRSISQIRLGGRPELTIQYNNYQITEAYPAGKSVTPQRWAANVQLVVPEEPSGQDDESDLQRIATAQNLVTKKFRLK